ncbi:MAG TPA: PAS domain S-box protein, partial [Trichocoleus sp.]
MFESHSQQALNTQHLQAACQPSYEELQALFNVLLEIEPAAIVLIDPDALRVMVSNSAIADLLGLADQALPKSVSSTWFASAGDYEQFKSCVHGKGLVCNQPLRLRHQQGQVVEVFVSAQTVDYQHLPVRLVRLLPSSQALEQRLTALQQQNTLLTTALHWAGDAIEITDAEARLQYVNPAFEAITGYTEAEAIGKTPAELFRGEQHDPAFYQSIWSTIAGGDVWSGELTSRHKNGSLLHQEACVAPVRDGAGAITHYVAVKRNVSQQKQTEAEWLKFVALVENSNDFIAMSALDGTVLYVNEAGRDLVGLEDLASAQAKSIAEYLPEDDLAEFCAVTLPTLQTVGRHSSEGQLRHFQTGKSIHVHRSCFAVKHPKSQQTLCLATIQRDITTQKQAAQALKESEERFRAIAEASPTAIAISRISDGTILYANSQVEPTL